jgi:hypothetical protein
MKAVAGTSALEGVASGGQEEGGFGTRECVGLRNRGDPTKLPLVSVSWSWLTRTAPAKLAPSRYAPSRSALSR